MTNTYFSQQVSISCTALIMSTIFFLTYSWYETFRHTWDYGLEHGLCGNFTTEHPLVDATFSSIYTLFAVVLYFTLRERGLVSDELRLA